MITVLTLILVAFIGGGSSGVIGVVASTVCFVVSILFSLIIIPVIMATVDNVKYHKALKK